MKFKEVLAGRRNLELGFNDGDVQVVGGLFS